MSIIDDYSSKRLGRYIDAVVSVLQKSNRILTGKPVSVRAASDFPHHHGGSPAPAFTDGADVYIGDNFIEQMRNAKQDSLPAFVVRLNGLNYHELSHILYSPRRDDAFGVRLRNEERNTGLQPTFGATLWYAFNALEDQRIESLFVSEYRPAHRFFEAIALEWLVKTPEAQRLAFPLTHGRKFLPDSIRLSAEATFRSHFGDSLADDFASVIDDYLSVTFPKEEIKAMGLIKRYRTLLEQLHQQRNTPDQVCPQPSQDGNPSGTAQGDMMGEGEASVARQKEAQQGLDDVEDLGASKGSGADDGDDGDDEDVDTDDSGSGQDGEDGESDGEAADGDANSDGAQGDGDSSDGDAEAQEVDGTQDREDSRGEGKGIGNSTGGGVPDAPLGDLAHDALEDILNDDSVLGDVDDLMDAVEKVMHRQDDFGRQYGAHVVGTVPGPARSVSNRIVKELSKIRLELEDERLHRQVYGRVNPGRLVTRLPHQVDIFDRWYEGDEDEGGIEAALMIDLSGSMGGIIDTTSQIVWAVKSAFDQLGIPCTALGYSHTDVLLYKPGERAASGQYRSYQVLGSTVPDSALRKVHDRLVQSDQPNRVLISVTDGGWGGSDAEHKRLLDSLHKQNTVSYMVGLDGAVSNYGLHHHQGGRDIDRIEGLARIATEIASRIMTGAIQSVR